jgi:hypothetical protein
MAHYVAIHNLKPKVMYDWWRDDRPGPSSISVIVADEDGPVKTGLCDAAGVPLYRIEDRNPCGFGK